MTIHILIIDDDPIFRMITVKMITFLDVTFLKVQDCEDGDIGLDSLERLSGTKHRVIVFLDINLPVLNGWSFLDNLKKNKYYNIKDISVFILSSSIDDSDKTKANSYEIVKRFIQKPLDLLTIRSIVIEN